MQGTGDDALDTLVTVATFQPVMLPHAHFLWAKLEAEGIICILNGQWFTEADAVRLQVKKADAARAIAIIDGAPNS
jgi:hypothetical protein